jgi:hypothetical protein
MPIASSSPEAEIQYVYVSEVVTEVVTQQNTYTAPDLAVDLIDRKKFIEVITTRFPEQYTAEKGALLWDVLLGNQPRPEPLKDLTKEEQPFLNPYVRYLTSNSCTRILNHLVQFDSGIDFQHLPLGFVLTKNPQGSGDCEVLHYNKYYARFQPIEDDTVLAVTLMDQTELKAAPQISAPFTGAQATWYEFFRKKCISESGVYCTEEQLLDAFTGFSNIVLDKGCKFEELTFSKGLESKTFNPIVLLGRWATVMTNSSLKASDVNKQWTFLPQLALTTSHEAIRAITDYIGQERSCGFLNPEMKLTQEGFLREAGTFEACFRKKDSWLQRKDRMSFNFHSKLISQRGFKPEDHYAKISGEILPIYQAYTAQNQNYSVNFYEKLLAHSEQYLLSKPTNDEESEKHKLTLQNNNHVNKNPIDFDLETRELASLDKNYRTNLIASFWRYLAYQPKRNSYRFYEKALERLDELRLNCCVYETMLQTLASSTTLTNCKKTATDEEEDLDNWNAYCSKTSRYPGIPSMLSTWVTRNGFMEYPRIAFLNDIVLRHFSNPISILAHYKTWIEWIQTWELLAFLMKESIYQGAKFYFVNNRWLKSDLMEYVRLQFDFYTLAGGKQQFIENFFIKTLNIGAEEFKIETELPKFTILARHLSTFNLDTKEIIQSVLSHWPNTLTTKNKEHFQFCFNLFDDAQANEKLTPLFLSELIQYLTTLSDNPTWRIDILDYLNKRVASSFEEHYFENKEKLIKESAFGLNSQQILNIKSCFFPEAACQALINFQCLFVKKNLLNIDAYLAELNVKLLNLKYIVPAEDFILFTEQLEEMGEQMAANSEDFLILLDQILTKRNTESFNQIFIRNEIEKSTVSLPKKFISYIGHIKQLSQMKDSKLPPLLLQEMLATLVLNAAHESLDPVEQLQQKLSHLLEQLNQVSIEYPHVSHYLLESFNHIPDKNSEQYLSHALTLGEDLQYLTKILASQHSEPSKERLVIIYSLLAHYHDHPTDFCQLMNKIRLAPPEQRPLLLKFVSRLIDNKQSIDGLETLIALLANEKNQALFSSMCITPPYPNIPTLCDWLKQDNFESHYHAFNLEPFGKRRLDYAFDLTKYKSQKNLFFGVGEVFTDALSLEINNQLVKNRTQSVQHLLEEYHQIRQALPLSPEDKLQLICLCTELLARTASQSGPGNNKISQELNTTQVMAVYAKMINPSNRLLSQIDTGEGKSRVMMVLAACQAAQGKTIDFLTSDMQLAERDYLSYRQYFTTLNIPSSLISLSTPALLYQKGGINITDNSQLLLLRNKSDIDGLPFAYLDENKEKRCLLIDEVDKFIHDKSKDSYNFAAQSKHLANFVWIYPSLIQYVETLPLTPGQPFAAEAHIEDFINHVKKNVLNKRHKACLLQIHEDNPSQISTWLKSAHKALLMEPDKHYLMTEERNDKLFLVRDSEGCARHSRKIFVLDNGRPVEGSSFSDGVHQCICAKENRRLNKIHNNKKISFVIMPENEILRPSFPVTFMADYDEGSIYGVSGTTRSAAPLSNTEDINHKKYTYLIMPREKPLIREDKNIWLAKNEAQQIEFLKRAIIKKMNEGSPVLLICKNDQQSLMLQNALDKDPKFKAKIQGLQMQRVHGKTTKQDEVHAIKEAGKANILTLSTAGMLGRGVDIDSDKLMVLAAYIPTEDDEIQIKGRAARMGKPGEYRMIIDMADKDHPIAGNTYNVDNEVHKSQKQRQKTAVFQEEVSNLFAFFREDIIRGFLDDSARCSDEQRVALLKKWKLFLGNLHRDWESCRKDMLTAVEETNKAQFFKLFNAFTEQWISKAPVQFNQHQVNSEKQDQELNKIYTAMMAQQRFFIPKRQAIKVQHEYDPSDDGQARVYSSLFAKTRATLRGERRPFADFHAWREGRGQLFPDFMAVLKGERLPFANLLATINLWIKKLKQWFKEKKEGSKHGFLQKATTPIPGDPIISINQEREYSL